MGAAAAHVEEWTGEGVSLAEVEKAISTLRRECAHETDGPDLRTSVMTHLAWVPPDWHAVARGTLRGLAERHPSRTILLVPGGAEGEDDLSARVEVAAFELSGKRRHVAAEIVELRLGSRRARAPASLVMPLLITGLPVFCRWRGRPPFGEPALEQLVELADRFVVDSREWDESAADYHRLAELFDRVAVSDVAWRRTMPWRAELARDWPEIAECDTLEVTGPAAEAALLAGWLRSRLDRDVTLERAPADELEAVAVDGRRLHAPGAEPPDSSALLSGELERFGRDRIYEGAVRAVEV